MKTLSEKDLSILQTLEDSGNITDDELSTRTGIEKSEAIAIRRSLEDQGIILKYRAIINWEKIESPDVVALIQVTVTPRKGLGYDEVAQKISMMDEVRSCLLVSGSFDLLVEVVGPSLKDVSFFVADKLAIIDGVEHTRTNFLLKRYKQGGDILMVSRKTHRLPMVI